MGFVGLLRKAHHYRLPWKAAYRVEIIYSLRVAWTPILFMYIRGFGLLRFFNLWHTPLKVHLKKFRMHATQENAKYFSLFFNNLMQFRGYFNDFKPLIACTPCSHKTLLCMQAKNPNTTPTTYSNLFLYWFCYHRAMHVVHVHN